MAATTFPQLPRELRDMIWSAAAHAQYELVSIFFCVWAAALLIKTPTKRIAVSQTSLPSKQFYFVYAKAVYKF
jgi:hypothetical protein